MPSYLWAISTALKEDSLFQPISAIDIDKSVYDQETEVSPQADTITTYFTHSYGAGISDFYTKPADNPYTEKITSDHTNNLCIKCEADYDDDTGYRTEIAIRPIKSSLKDTYGGLQRFDFSADYYMDSDYNIDNNDYYTYIFQLHDANFSVAGWTDAPPLALRVIGGKIYAYVAYIDTGNIPAGDNVHTSDGYLLGDFEMDKWHHIEVKARIGWKTSLLSKLTIALDGVEVLDIKTPIGFNIVSSDGWVNVQTGLYIPEWRTGTYTDRHREIMISNIKWKGTQHLVS